MQKFECSYPKNIKNKAGASFVFDPVNDASHRALLDRMLDKFKRETPEASDAELDYIDAERHVAVLVDRSVASVEDSGDRKVVKLAASQCTPSAAAKVQASYESSLPGFRMTEFRPYEGRAIFERLTAEQTTARGFLTAAMGLKPWEAKVEPAKDGGWHCVLDSSIVYTSDKFDSKVQSACLQIGKPGWYFDADAREGVIDIHPGEPQTFPKTVPFSFDRLGESDTRDRMPFGMLLARPGEEPEECYVDWTQSLGLLVAGLSGGGKALPLDSKIPVPLSARFPDGWASIGDLNAGDPVYTPDGATAPISSFSQIEEREVWELHLSDGQTIECSGDHLWRVASGKFRIVHTGPEAEKRKRGEAMRRHFAAQSKALREAGEASPEDLFESMNAIASKACGMSYAALSKAARNAPVERQGKLWSTRQTLLAAADEREWLISQGRLAPLREAVVTTQWLSEHIVRKDGTRIEKNFAIRLPEPFDGPDASLPIGPYWLGAWLGDGISRHGAICLNDEDEPLMQPDLLSSLGGSIRRKEPQAGASTWHYDRDDGIVLDTQLRLLGLWRNKHIPAAYLRASKAQRLALLQGIMDTDGTIDPHGSCELCLTNERLAHDALELIRSLGVKACIHESEAAYTQDGERHAVGTRYRMSFTTSLPVFRLPRKAGRIPESTRGTQDWAYVTDAVKTSRTAPMRCIRLDTADHMYLAGGFVPTHNSVTINDLITMSVATGCELYICDHSTKATDFFWCRPWVKDKGWGADSLLQTAGLLKSLLDDIEEGGSRAKVWKEHGWQNWYDDLDDAEKRANPLRLIVVDELSQLTVGAKDATSIPKSPLPPVMERMFEQQTKSLILSTLIRLLQIGRAYGYRFIVATQIASSNTGMPPALRGNLGNKIIMGAKVNDAQKNLIFNIARDVPDVPANVIDEGVSKGAGLAEMEGQKPFDFKSAFPMLGHHAGVQALGEALAKRIGLPNGIAMSDYLDSLDKSTPSNPGFNDDIMRRIRFPESESYIRFPFLQAIKDKWDEANDEFGGGADPVPVDDGDNGPKPKPKDMGTGAKLMDASELARIMEQG